MTKHKHIYLANSMNSLRIEGQKTAAFEIVDLLGALNTGHDGGAGTLHANAPADVPARLAPPEAVFAYDEVGRLRAVSDVDGDTVLLALREGTGYRDGWWNVPSGKLEYHEDALTGIRREAHEEIGVRFADDEPFAGVVHHGNPEGRGRIAAVDQQPQVAEAAFLEAAAGHRKLGDERAALIAEARVVPVESVGLFRPRAPYKPITVGELLARRLRDAGVRRAYGFPGGGTTEGGPGDGRADPEE